LTDFETFGLSPMATKRIQKEILALNTNPVKYIELSPSDDSILIWKGSITGPESTPYEGAKFIIELIFPENYPFSPPTFKFITKVYHPNIDEQGNICIAMLKQEVLTLLT
jgi:ubiquitin-conjugating enzyme E2 D/E